MRDNFTPILRLLGQLPEGVQEWTPELPLVQAPLPVTAEHAARYWKHKTFTLYGLHHKGGSYFGLSKWARYQPANARWVSGSVVACTPHKAYAPFWQNENTRMYGEFDRITQGRKDLFGIRVRKHWIRPSCHADELVAYRMLRRALEYLS